MSRPIPGGLLAQLESDNVRAAWLFEGEFESGSVYLWTGIGPLAWDGKTFEGVGDLGGVSPVSETLDLRAEGITVSLSGIKSSMLSLVLGEARQGRPCHLWLAALTEAGELDGEPHMAFSGRMDVPRINDDGATATIAITAETRLIDLARPRERRFSHEDQQIDFPGDRGFEYVTAITSQDIRHGGVGSDPWGVITEQPSPDQHLSRSRNP